MPINKIDYTSAIDALEGSYNLNWFPTNFGATGAPQLPAGMVIPILGFPYIVEGGDVLPSGSPSDGLVYIKITPNVGDGGLTADAAFTNTFSGSWNGAYNGWYDGNSFFLNFFCTKATTNYNGKGFWLNWRERKLAQTTGSLDIDDTLSSVNGNFSGTLEAATLQPTIFSIPVVSGANALLTFDDSIYISNTSNVKGIYARLYLSGVVRVDFTLERGTARIYVNGSAVGTTRTVTTPAQSFTQDINISPGDSLEIYYYSPGSNGYITNTKYCVSVVPSESLQGIYLGEHNAIL